MIGLLKQHSRSAALAIGYVTTGALAMIWAGIWLYWMLEHGVERGDSKYYVCLGLFLSGLAVFIIGLAVGRLGREAKQADTTAGVVAPQIPGAGMVAPAAPVAGAPVMMPAPPVATVPMVTPQQVQSVR
jgi:hypothetical protein